MVLNVVIAVIGVVLSGISIVLIYYKSKHDDFPIPAIVPAISIILSVVLAVFSVSVAIVPTGYTGVRTTLGQISDQPVHSGFNWKIPFVQSIKYVNNKQQDSQFGDEKIWSETEDRTAIFYEGVTVTYQINPNKSAWIYANVSDYKNSLVSDNIVASAIKSSSKSLSDIDATNRSIVEPLIAKNLQNSINEKYGDGTVTILKVTVNNIDFDEAYQAAIAAKQQSKLEAEQQEIENKKAIDKAEADAAVAKKNAEAEAEAKLIKSKAEAEANDVLNKSLTDKVLKEKYIEKWDGKLPSIVSDDSAIVVQP